MPIKHKRTKPLVAATILIAVFGLGVGWIAGRVISGAMNHRSPASAPPAGHDSSSISQPQPETQSPARSTSEGSKPPQPETAPPIVKTEEERPKDERDVTQIPDPEQSSKEIGRQALKKMMKEIKKMNRGKDQEKPKNENENRR